MVLVLSIIMPARISVFPITFAVSVVALGVAYRYRKSFFGDVWEKQRNDYFEGKLEAARFKAEFAEKLEKEKSK